MRYVLKASAMLMLCVRISSADTELVELSRMTIHGPAGSNIVSWTLPSDAFEKQPRWDPLNQEIPLLPHAAIKAAAAWLQKEGEATNDLRVASLDLRLSHKDKWLYWIRFTPTVSLAKSRFVPSTVLVTLDGTVIEPGPVNTNAIPATTVSARRPFVSETRTSTNATSAIPIGMKGSYETVEAKIIKVRCGR